MFSLAGRLMLPFSLFIALLALTNLRKPSLVDALENGLARTPPMGWSSWERFTCTVDCAQFPDDCIDSRLYQSMADKLILEGYATLGYKYVHIDDCWSEMSRDPGSNNLVANASLFPNGIDKLADYIHAKGLKLGIYGDCGTKTCAGYPAQLKSEEALMDNYFDLDANQFASWKVDSLKFDGCNIDPAVSENVCPSISKAIAATNWPMLIICEWPFYMLREHYNFNKQIGPDLKLAQNSCNAWRYFEDIEDSWLSILNIIDFTVRIQRAILPIHGPGNWFYPDQLVVGNFALSLDQARAQMAIWCIWSAPLYMSNDLRHTTLEMAGVLKNSRLIQVDQDPLGVFGMMMVTGDSGRYQAFVKPVEPIKHGCPSFVVVYFNRNTLGNKHYISFKLRDLLQKVDFNLVAERYNSRLATESLDVQSTRTGQAPQQGERMNGQKCEKFIKFSMTREPSSDLLCRSPNTTTPGIYSLEEAQVHFEVSDLFEDERSPSQVKLNDELRLKVNPSGVRVVKLVRI